jgi:hypothetical protein
MMLMLGGPVVLHLIAHIMFPLAGKKVNITEYYLSKSKLIWSLAIITVFISTLFIPLTFGQPLFIVDNVYFLHINFLSFADYEQEYFASSSFGTHGRCYYRLGRSSDNLLDSLEQVS